MKKMLLLAGIMLCTAYVTRAQKVYGIDTESLYYGVNVGLNFANMDKNGGGEALVRTNAGALIGYRFGRVMAAEAQVLYSGSGTSYWVGTLADTKIDDYIHLNLTYVNIPIIARIYAWKGLNFQVGVQPGFLVRKRFNYRGDKFEVGDNVEFASSDFCIPLGLGYDFGRLGLDVRYQQGTGDVIKGDEVTTRNTMVMVNLNVKFQSH